MPDETRSNVITDPVQAAALIGSPVRTPDPESIESRLLATLRALIDMGVSPRSLTLTADSATVELSSVSGARVDPEAAPRKAVPRSYAERVLAEGRGGRP